MNRENKVMFDTQRDECTVIPNNIVGTHEKCMLHLYVHFNGKFMSLNI